MGEGSFLALVGNPCRDVVSIKILVGRHLKPKPQLLWVNMSSNEIDSNNVNGSQLAEEGPSSGRCSWQGNIGGHHANPFISSRRRKWTTQENKIIMESCLLSKPKIKGYRKSMLSLWLQKGMFRVLEQRLLNQANTISKNSWMTELKKDGLERKVTKSDSVIVEEVLRLCLIM